MKTRTQIVTAMTLAVLSFLWPVSVYAKRNAPAPVPPVVWQGVEYRAPLDIDDVGHVQAFELSSGRKLWETKVYHVWIFPLLEDQWVFISGLQMQDGKLLVRNEQGKSYTVDPKTGRVDGSMPAWIPWLLASSFLVGPALYFWVRKRRRRQCGQA